ncbi:MAG TPA: hypothetical protein VF286_07200, partial [Acidiphilium sp.]
MNRIVLATAVALGIAMTGIAYAQTGSDAMGNGTMSHAASQPNTMSHSAMASGTADSSSMSHSTMNHDTMSQNSMSHDTM